MIIENIAANGLEKCYSIINDPEMRKLLLIFYAKYGKFNSFSGLISLIGRNNIELENKCLFLARNSIMKGKKCGWIQKDNLFINR